MLKFGNKAPRRSDQQSHQSMKTNTKSQSPSKLLLASSALPTTSSSSSGSQSTPRHAQRYSLTSCIQSNAVTSTYSRPANPIKLTNELDHLDQLLAQADSVNSSGSASSTTDMDIFVGDATLGGVSSGTKRNKADSRIARPGLGATTTTMDQITSGIQNVSLKHDDEMTTEHYSSVRSSYKKIQAAATKTNVAVSRQVKEKKQDTDKSSSSCENSSGDDQADKKGSESGEDYSDDEDEGDDGYKVGGYHRVQIGDVYNQRYGFNFFCF
jgi:hypothetical protein